MGDHQNVKTVLQLVAIGLWVATAIAGPEADAAKKQAQKCADAMIAKDYDTVVAFTHTNLLRSPGGKEAVRKAIESGMKEVAEQGITFEKTTIGSPSEPKKVGKALVSLVPQEVILRTKDGRLKNESTLVAYSYDQGKNWTFADTDQMDEATFFKYFPDLKGIISLPPKKEPVPLPDKKD